MSVSVREGGMLANIPNSRKRVLISQAVSYDTVVNILPAFF